MSSVRNALGTEMRLIAALSLTMGLALAGCEDDDQVKSAAPEKQPTTLAAAKVTEAAPLPLGTAGRSGAFEIVVTGVEKPTEWTKTPPAGQQYIVAKIQVTNISEKAESIGAGSFGCVREESGTRGTVERYTGIKTVPATFGAEEIAPGGKFAGSLIYLIPVGMKQTELHYTVGYSLKPNLRFEIKL